MDVHLRRLAAAQADMVAAWQLLACGWTRRGINRRAAAGNWTAVHAGVFALTQGPLMLRQRRFAAVLTAPDTWLGRESAACCWGFRTKEPPEMTVTRAGSGGPRSLDGVRVLRSELLVGQTTTHDGIPITSAARTLIDCAARQPRYATGRAFREALRLGVTSTPDIAATLHQHPGRRGTRYLWDLTERYGGLPYKRTRSNAEARALEILHDASLSPDKVNAQIAGEEADLIWVARRRIIEIDGPQYHQFRDEDERKQGIWEDAGYTVKRISSQAVYDTPDKLISLAAT